MRMLRADQTVQFARIDQRAGLHFFHDMLAIDLGRKRTLAGSDDGLECSSPPPPTDCLKSQIICAAQQFLSMRYLSLSAAST